MQPGELLRLESLSAERWQFAHCVATELGLKSAYGSKDACQAAMARGTLEVFHVGGSLEEFSKGIQRTLERLKPGEILDLPGCLSLEQKNIVHAVAFSLRLVSHDFPPYPDGVLSVGHLGALERRVRSDVKALVPGQSASYEGEDMAHPLGREIVMRVARECGCDHLADEGATRMTVTRPDEKVVKEPVIFTISTDGLTDAKMREMVFDGWASGRSGRVKYLRKPDLNRYIRYAAPRQNLDADSVQEQCDEIFDDTLELQVDMGSRIIHGITIDYFNVFLTKVAGMLHVTLMVLLKSLLEWFER
eukprot:TRINITY_DN13303_c0_g1_i2.p1 TRINITY_DN13303_c0_g1~~TRINITY_DN13303_c0_g1_i2.p1  ORF type:complete len:304 (+),score=41.42 TRINITY_DN13303_c0_g1_i2:700-1611(+)